VGEDELSLAVLCGLDENLDLVTDLQVRIVTEFRGGDDTFALRADVDNHFPLVDCGDDTFDDLVLDNLREGLGVQFVVLGFVCGLYAVILKSIPVKLFGSD